MHVPTHYRGATFLSGIRLAYMLHNKSYIDVFKNKVSCVILVRSKSFNLISLKMLQALCWTIALIIVIMILLSIPMCNIFGVENSVIREYNYLSLGFFHALWATAVGWIILACYYGFGGFINRFLSHKYWQPISRMCLSIYLIHPIIQYHLTTLNKQPVELSGSNMVSDLKVDLKVADVNFIYSSFGC